MRRRSSRAVPADEVSGEDPPPRPALLTIAAERQIWHRSVASQGGERSPAGRIHAVFGKADHTLCGVPNGELAAFPYRDFTEGPLQRCDICRARGAALLH